MIAQKADNNIENFKLQEYINESRNTKLFQYIKTFLPEKFKNTGEIIIPVTFSQYHCQFIGTQKATKKEPFGSYF